jgi:hypothetical protein
MITTAPCGSDSKSESLSKPYQYCFLVNESTKLNAQVSRSGIWHLAVWHELGFRLFRRSINILIFNTNKQPRIAMAAHREKAMSDLESLKLNLNSK